MKFERYEIIGMAIAVVVAAGFFALVRFDVWSMVTAAVEGQEAGIEDPLEGAIVLKEGENTSIAEAFSTSGKVDRLVVQDVAVGTGNEVEAGSRVAVHYVGVLQNGQTFKNTYNDDKPYRFTVGMGDVIAGWDQGIMGMCEGGKRILVVPPALGYGSRSLDDVPPNSTLLFSIELVSVE